MLLVNAIIGGKGRGVMVVAGLDVMATFFWGVNEVHCAERQDVAWKTRRSIYIHTMVSKWGVHTYEFMSDYKDRKSVV